MSGFVSVPACRFLPAFNDLADQHWPHNIVVVTHGYGVSSHLDYPLRRGTGLVLCGWTTVDTLSSAEKAKSATHGG